MYLKITKHAEMKRFAWGISKDDIKKAIKRGEKFKQAEEQKLAWYGWFGVVYIKIGDDCYKIITLKDRMREK